MNVFVERLLKAVPMMLISPLAFSQAAVGQEPETPQDAFETVVVTASSGQTTQFRSSISVNSISVDEVAEFSARGTAEIFRNIPGVR